MSAVRIRDRTGLAEVKAGARVEPEISAFFVVVGFPSHLTHSLCAHLRGL